MPGIFKGRLIGHEDVHAAFCGVCGYVAASVCRVRAHYLRHTGEKPFKCPFCRFASARNENLVAHIHRIHLAVVTD
jgi:hypothetical protein